MLSLLRLVAKQTTVEMTAVYSVYLMKTLSKYAEILLRNQFISYTTWLYPHKFKT